MNKYGVWYRLNGRLLWTIVLARSDTKAFINFVRACPEAEIDDIILIEEVAVPQIA